VAEKAWVPVGQRKMSRDEIVNAKKREDLSFLRRRIRVSGFINSSVGMMSIAQDSDCSTSIDDSSR